MGDDKLLLLDHFRDFYAAQAGAAPFDLDEAARARWLRYPFPGQRARAAQHRDPPHHQISRPALSAARTGARVRPADRRPRRGQRRRATRAVDRRSAQLAARPGFSLDDTLKAWERGYIEAALELTHGNISQAAKLLGVNRTTLYSRMEALHKDKDSKYRRGQLAHVPRAFRPRRAAVPHHAAHRFLLRRRQPRRDARGAALRHHRTSEGIVKVTGEVGSGKTMLCRVLMERLPEHVETIYLANPSLSRDEMLYAIADGLGLNLEGQRVNVILQTLQNLLDAKSGRGQARGRADRRGARHAAGDAGRIAPAVQPASRRPQAAADRAVRPARTQRQARPAQHAPAQGPHHASLPHAAAVAKQ